MTLRLIPVPFLGVTFGSDWLTFCFRCLSVLIIKRHMCSTIWYIAIIWSSILSTFSRTSQTSSCTYFKTWIICWKNKQCHQIIENNIIYNNNNYQTNILMHLQMQRDVWLEYIINLQQYILRNVAFHWLTSEYMQLASGFMQLAAAGRIGATKYIFTVFL